jgi:hypothetical protein
MTAGRFSSLLFPCLEVGLEKAATGQEQTSEFCMVSDQLEACVVEN